MRRITDASSGEVSYTQTFKAGNGLSREEIEYGITEGIYGRSPRAGVRAADEGPFTAQWDGRIVEIDRYDQIQLTVLEVEFDSVEEAQGSPAGLGSGRISAPSGNTATRRCGGSSRAAACNARRDFIKLQANGGLTPERKRQSLAPAVGAERRKGSDRDDNDSKRPRARGGGGVRPDGARRRRHRA